MIYFSQPFLFRMTLAVVLALVLVHPQPVEAQILDDWGELDAVPQLWFNRVDGLHVGAEIWAPLVLANEVTVDAAYKTALGRASYGIRVENRAFGTTVGASYRDDVQPRYTSRILTRPLNGLYTLVGGTDYYDYLERRGGTFFIEPFTALPTIEPRLTYRFEQHQSVARQSSYDLFGAKEQPPNPAIEEGNLAALEARIGWQPFHRTARALHVRRVELVAEHGDSWLGGDFDYSRLAASVDARLRMSREQRPPVLRTRLNGGGTLNGLPVQRFGIVETAPQPLSVFGGFRTGADRPYEGERFGSAFWELNLRGAPLAVLGLDLLSRRWDIYLHGGHGWTEISDDRRQQLAEALIFPRTTPGAIHELGVGIGRLLRIIRLDATWRLDEPGFGVRAGLTSPF